MKIGGFIFSPNTHGCYYYFPTNFQQDYIMGVAHQAEEERTKWYKNNITIYLNKEVAIGISWNIWKVYTWFC